MIRLAEFRDWIATLDIAEDDNCYCGLLRDKKDKSIGIYPLSLAETYEVKSLKYLNEHQFKGLSILLHWSTSFTESEEKAFELYKALEEATDIELNECYATRLFMRNTEPLYVGPDDNGIYEFVIEIIALATTGLEISKEITEKKEITTPLIYFNHTSATDIFKPLSQDSIELWKAL